jgi:hypothetical protein
MANDYTEQTTREPQGVQVYPPRPADPADKYDTNTPASVPSDPTTQARPHECHCAPDAPCRLSGRCTCIKNLNDLLNKLEPAKKN